MTNILLLSAIVIFACVLLNRVSAKMGVPMLLAFILLGMFFGDDGILKIKFDDYTFADNICSAALIFIMFYGGFGTNWTHAKPIAVRAVLLSTFGVLITSLIVGVFCHYVFKIDFILSVLIGSVVGSTDAASVFSIFRSRKLGLKYNTASMLEMESGSNDPFSYMLTVICITMMTQSMQVQDIALMVITQLGVGIAVGVVVALASVYVIKNFDFGVAGFNMVFVVGVALISYSLSATLGGNGYLSAYIAGIILGNSKIKNTKDLVYFFDGLTGLMQMLIFFLLGLLSAPSKFPEVAGRGILIALFLTLVARPIAVFLILAPFKAKLGQIGFVSFAGLRGAASIVFSIMVVQNGHVGDLIFHSTFFIVLLSILVQGSLLPWAARIFDMIDTSDNVMKSFTDYSEEAPVHFIQFDIPVGHDWNGKTLKEITMPPQTIVALVQEGNNFFVPNGKTVIKENFKMILGATSADEIAGVELSEIYVSESSEYKGLTVSEFSNIKFGLIIMIKRKDEITIPNGDTIINEGDLLVINKTQVK